MVQDLLTRQVHFLSSESEPNTETPFHFFIFLIILVFERFRAEIRSLQLDPEPGRAHLSHVDPGSGARQD